MNNNIYFDIYIKNKNKKQIHIVIRIPIRPNFLPGTLIKNMNKAVHTVPLGEGEVIRTELLINSPAPSPNIYMRQLSNYLLNDGNLDSIRLVKHIKTVKN